MPEHEPHRPAAGPQGAEPAAEPEMTRRAMLILGGGASVAVASVLGLTLVMGGSGSTGPRSDPARQTQVEPAGGTAAPAGGPSGTAAPVPAATVPQLVGLGSMTAVGRLAAQRIPLGALIRVPSSQPTGLVLRSFPASGTRLNGGAPVTLYVSAGLGGAVTGSRVIVPYLIGLPEEQARTSAAGLGLRVVVTTSEGRVTAQVPAAGTSRLRGSTLTLTLG